jgi:hypothetical protein
VEWGALVAALIGGSVVAILRISYERGEKIRERKIDAADEFVAVVLQALLRIRDAGKAVQLNGQELKDGLWQVHDPKTGELLPEIQDAIERALELRDEAFARLSRVQLLFGASEAALAGEWATIWIQRALFVLRMRPVDMRRHHETAAEARAAHMRFSRSALADINRPWWRPRLHTKPSASGTTENVSD